MSDEDLRRLSTILQDTKPSALGIALNLTRFEFHEVISTISPVRENLTHLSLSIIFEPEEGENSVNLVIVSFFL